MMNNMSSMIDDVSDFETLNPTASIELYAEQIQQAAATVQSIHNYRQQWKAYLNALALSGLQNWLQSRENNIVLNIAQASVLDTAYAGVIDAVCRVEVNGFKLCLLVADSQVGNQISVPRAVIDLPEFAAQLYVLIKVFEEQEMVVVQGCVRADQLPQLQTEPDWTYSFPVDQFADDPNTLLLYLRCAKPETIPLPQLATTHPPALAQHQTELLRLIPQLQATDRPWWEVLTWEQGAAILRSFELMQWLNQPTVDRRPRLADLFQMITRPAINTACWLSNELDQLAQELSWVLLPSLASGLRSSPLIELPYSVQELTNIVTEIERRGMQIPVEGRAACQDVILQGHLLRLFAISAVVESAKPEWSLSLIVGPQPGAQLPVGLRLQVSDWRGILNEQELSPDLAATYLYAQVEGNWQETFWVTIALPDGATKVLPFTFQPQLQ